MNDVGTHVSRLIWENLMSPTDTLEALSIFAQFAESSERGQEWASFFSRGSSSSLSAKLVLFEFLRYVEMNLSQIVYIRLLFNMLQKDLKTVEVLHLFSLASAAYSQTGIVNDLDVILISLSLVKRVLASDNQFKLIVEKSLRVQQNARSSLSEPRDGGQPKIELKMNFSNYS
jgi:hypothetical protein